MENVNFRKNILVGGSFLLSAYFVIFLWNFWEDFIEVLGFNMTVFIVGFLVVFFLSTGANAFRKNYFWVMPLLLIALSFSLWENPFLKVINFIMLPFLLSIFFAYALSPKRELSFNFMALGVLERVLTLVKIPEAIKMIFGIGNFKNDKFKFLSRIAFGIILFLLIAFSVIIPLLSSADPEFARMMRGILDWIEKVFSFKYINRIIFAILSAIIAISYFLSFAKKNSAVSEGEIKEKENKELDPIVSGIVLGGVLFIYLLFLYTQLAQLWVSQLPINFQETERLVKSGFWQLFTLSILNIFFFFIYFKKTNKTIQNILKLFMLASLFLLFSAAHRMFLYVFYYGLSYEKFFASYAVIYFILIFIWLFYQLFRDKNGQIFKFLVYSLLWMYAVLTVMPVERMIFSANVQLSTRPDSRIKLNELQMLSYDAMPLVVAYNKDGEWQKDWCDWGYYEIKKIRDKKWYEKNFSNYTSVVWPEKWADGSCLEEYFRSLHDETKNDPAIDDSGVQKEEINKDERMDYKNDKFGFSVKYSKSGGWMIIKYFDTEKNKDMGTFVYKDEKNNVFIIPVLDQERYYADKGAVITEDVLGGEYIGKKRVWKKEAGSYFMTIKLSNYPASWNKNNIIEAKYTKETEKDIEEIISSISFDR